MEDIKLWDLFKSGDKAAFEQIYTNEVQFLVRYGRSMSYALESVEDALHELFVEIWEARERLSTPTSIRSYLLVSLRRKLHKSNDKMTTGLSEYDTMNESVPAFEDELIQSEQERSESTMILNGMNLLSTKQREILHLKYYQGLDYEAISEILGINYQSARNAVHRAIKELSLVIKKDGS
jgi:RNA polymerase sigma-70 factor (ECF subfamily)